jgi:hypothetical protein
MPSPSSLSSFAYQADSMRCLLQKLHNFKMGKSKWSSEINLKQKSEKMDNNACSQIVTTAVITIKEYQQLSLQDTQQPSQPSTDLRQP